MFFLIISAALAVLILLFLAALSPRTSKQEQCGEFLQRSYAHRGLFSAEEKTPENSILAFKRAIRYGFPIELDVQLTKDKEAIVFHDDSLKRMCGIDAMVREKTLSEIQQLTLQNTGERIPLFSEVLETVSGQVPLLIELKLPTKSTMVCIVANEILRKYKGAYCIQSFSPFALNWYRSHHPEVLRGQLSDHYKKSEPHPKLLLFMAQNLLFNWFGKPDFISYNHHYAKKCLTLQLLKRLFHIPVFAWTIRSQQDYNRCKNQFDALIFDHFIPENTKNQEASICD